jgi:hypothetical protein
MKTKYQQFLNEVNSNNKVMKTFFKKHNYILFFILIILDTLFLYEKDIFHSFSNLYYTIGTILIIFQITYLLLYCVEEKITGILSGVELNLIKNNDSELNHILGLINC